MGRSVPAALADMERKAFGVVRIVRQKTQLFALHCAARAARGALRSTGRESAALAGRTSRFGPARNRRRPFLSAGQAARYAHPERRTRSHLLETSCDLFRTACGGFWPIGDRS